MHSKTLEIVGLGISSTRHLTVEAIESMTKADIVLATPNCLQDILTIMPGIGRDRVVDISSLYLSGQKDESNYRAWLAAITGALADYDSVVVAIPGHPRVGVTLLQWIENDPPPDTSIIVQPGISSFNTLINLVKIDPLERGCALLEANRILLFKQSVNPEYDTFIYHICSVGTNKANYADATMGNRIDLLVGHLLKFYEPTHEVYLCQSEEVRLAGDFMHRVNLSDLGSVIEHVNFSTSFFVPAVQPTAIDEDFLALLRN